MSCAHSMMGKLLALWLYMQQLQDWGRMGWLKTTYMLEWEHMHFKGRNCQLPERKIFTVFLALKIYTFQSPHNGLVLLLICYDHLLIIFNMAEQCRCASN